ncbi:TPA: DcrB-related protein [Pseudomonas putida]
MDYQLQEGSITLPEGFQDRTVNMFILGDSIPAPLNITVSRDNLLVGEDLKAYIERQVKLIASKLRGYTVLGKKPAQLSTSQPLAGIQVDGYYLKDGRPVYQRQAAFEVSPGRILVFSTTSQADFGGKQNESWQALLSSFEARQANPTDTTTQG